MPGVNMEYDYAYFGSLASSDAVLVIPCVSPVEQVPVPEMLVWVLTS